METASGPAGEGGRSVVDEQDTARWEDNGGAVVDLDRGEVTIRLPPSEPTMPMSLEPTSWWEWQCPVCGHVCDGPTHPCPVDRHLPKRTRVSMPFLWLG